MRSVPRLEHAFYVAALALSTAAGIPGLTQSAHTSDLQSLEPTPQWVWYGVYVVVVVLCLTHLDDVLAVVERNKLAFCVALWALFSAAWSDASGLTLRRSVALFLTVAFGCLLATRLSVGDLFDLACRVTAGIVVASVAVALLVPAYGLDHLRGDAWRGVFNTKNELGRVAALAAVLWILRLVIRRRSRLVSAAVVAVSLMAVSESASRTALVVVGALAVLMAGLPALRASSDVMVAGTALMVATIGGFSYWLAHHPGAVLSTVGGDSTFTGRTRIWSAVWLMIHKHYWFGWGYDAFWRGVNGPSAFVWSYVSGTPPHAHDGYLDVWLELGLVGLCLVAALLVTSALRAWLLVRSGPLQDTWPLVFVGFIVLYNLTESCLATRNSLFWILFVAASAACGSALAERRVRAGRREARSFQPRASRALT